MAQKYLMALDYVDLHANTILQKHAKKRPLGDLESRHRYTPTQPVLSCRTVDIDVSGTRTYRPKSSADIITEQHALIHQIYSKSRNITSAPPRRSKTPRNKSVSPSKSSLGLNSNQNKENNLKSVEVQGRPLTSLSQRTSKATGSRSSVNSNKRPKTTGNIKGPKVIHDNFMVVHADQELIETRRSYRSLTDKIHKHWEPENHNLNQGTYQRGKKPPGVPSVDSWLTFSGSQSEESQGIVDAFAEHVLEAFLEDSDSDGSTLEDEELGQAGEYYNIEGGVGSRIAQQLQKGDKIRIGINGTVQTQDLKVKKWLKEDSYVKPSESEPRENTMAATDPGIIPLSWDDQVASAKIITPREVKGDKSTINLNETTPVVFTKLVPDELAASLPASYGMKREGYRVKQRKKNKPGMDGREQENKVTVVSIDSRSKDDEVKIEGLTVDEVIKQKNGGKGVEKQNGHSEEMEKHSVSFSFADESRDLQDTLLSQSKGSITESVSSGGSDQKPLKVKPSQPTFSTKTKEVDLDIIGTLTVSNGQRPLSSESEMPAPSMYSTKMPYPMSRQGRTGSARSTRSGMKSAKSQKSLVSSSLVSVGGQGYRQCQNEAEYIQIAHPVKNPNSGPIKRSTDYTSQSDTPRSQRSQSGIREPVPSPELESLSAVEKANNPVIEEEEMPPKPVVVKVATPALSISIPTAEYTDSALNSPTQKHSNGPHTSPQMRRAKDMRDEQIDQITDMLVDAIIGPNNGAES